MTEHVQILAYASDSVGQTNRIYTSFSIINRLYRLTQIIFKTVKCKEW